MAEKVTLTKQVYTKESFNKVIDTSFPTDDSIAAEEQLNTLSISEFFQNYDQLFYNIPKEGLESHTTLIKRSQEYVGDQQTSEELDALIQEVNGLRETVLEQQELIFNLTVSGSNNV